MNKTDQYLREHFEEIKEALAKEYDIGSAPFKAWIKPLSYEGIEEDQICIGIPDRLNQMLSYINEHYHDMFLVFLSEQLTRLEEQPLEVRFFVKAGEEKSSYNNEAFPADPVPDPASDSGDFRSNLNPRYTFDSFVVGNNNRMAQAASVAVAESPGKVFNPLFLYSNAGLGKTHLMHSIGNHILERNPGARVLYVTSETFVNDVVSSIQNSKNSTQEMSRVRKKYRDVDVLMVDDVQFVIGKEATQLEFFHTFNELHSAGKAIVLSSDKPPKDMVTLEERFRSRFEMGLIVDIQPPDYETRLAILQKNAESYPGYIDDEVFRYIAENVRSNIRELEGAFNKIMAQSRLLGQAVTLQTAEEVLQDLISDRENTVTPQRIIDKTCEFFGISKEDIISQKRSKEISLPRQIAMYHIRMMTDTSFDGIGKLLGGRDHTTVISGIDKIQKGIKVDPKLAEQVENLRNKIKPTV